MFSKRKIYNLMDALERPRQSGKTTAICDVARARGSRVVANTAHTADTLTKEHGVAAIGLEAVFQGHLRGSTQSVIMDAPAIISTVAYMMEEIERLEEQATLKVQLENKLRELLP